MLDRGFRSCLTLTLDFAIKKDLTLNVVSISLARMDTLVINGIDDHAHFKREATVFCVLKLCTWASTCVLGCRALIVC
jgi:hypothetical protein